MSRRSVAEVRRHRVPTWWSDAKLGIFVHWTLASVPAFAPVDADMAELLARRDPHALASSPYAEWYQNSLSFEDSAVAAHHATHFAGRAYNSFASEWEAGLEQWDPAAWARHFAATGARYVVLVTKHHEGYCLWPSEVVNPHAPSLRCARDVVGELAAAVRSEGLRFGVYYSGGLDWTFNDHPIGTFSDLLVAQPRGDYLAYADAQVRELIDRYQPSVLWNDISWPGTVAQLAELLAYYYRAVPDGVVNDRFMPWSATWRIATTRPARRVIDGLVARGARADRGIIPPRPPLFDVRTPEYTTFGEIQGTPWECVRGIDHSFGYNRMSRDEDFLGRDDLVWSLADIAAKGGNLLLNVGPRGEDATIPDAQLQRLEWLGAFTADAGDALFATRPWVLAEGRGDGGIEVRYTARDRKVFAFVRRTDQQRPAPSALTLAEVEATPRTMVTTASGASAASRESSEGLVIELAGDEFDDPHSVLVLVLDEVRASSRLRRAG
ncbi:MAG TPA: alpha-L-fucosidase [Acidimicrobiales bacterium]|jgi:alpha-L-fucosidase|nr:alpha-L-fucosidase [Acidimicrobiales bacterium]